MPISLPKLSKPIVTSALLVLMVMPSAALADGNEQRGKVVVDQWCRTCHQSATDKPDPDLAPTFEDIVRRPGRTRAYFEEFLEEDHFPMTTFRLFDDEKVHVVAYLMALQRAAKK